MKDRAVTYLSLAVSVLALGYAAWLHHHSEEMAMKALRERESEFVRYVGPTLRTVVADVTQQTNVVVAAPTTLEDLVRMVQPVFKIQTHLQEQMTNDQEGAAK